MSKTNPRQERDTSDDGPAGTEKQPGTHRSWSSFSVQPPRLSDEDSLVKRAGQRLQRPVKKPGNPEGSPPEPGEISPDRDLSSEMTGMVSEPPFNRIARSLSNLLAVISLSLIFGGMLGLLVQWIAGQR